MKRSGNQSNALLVELLIVIFFFMLGSTILVRVYAKAYQMTRDAEICTHALAKTQNTADMLYASGDIQEKLRELGFAEASDETVRAADDTARVWELPDDKYMIRVTVRDRETDAGRMREMKAEAVQGEEILVSLPCSRFIPA